MKKKYEPLEWEMIFFSTGDIMTESTSANSSCPEDCSSDCSICYYLVCEPQDVIIGG